MASRRTSPDPRGVRLVVRSLGTGPLPPDSADWSLALPLFVFHRLEGLALARAAATGGRLPADVRAALEPAARRGALETTLAVEAARKARGALEGAGVRSLLIKGAALVEAGVYEEPGARRMDDADLVVRPEAAAAAIAALQAAGFVPWSPWTPSRTRWLDSATLSDPSAPPGLPVAIDLHWRVAYGGLRFGAGPEDDLVWRGASPAAGIPSHEAHLLIVAEHLLKHLRSQVHLAAYADLVRLAGRVEAWDDVVAWARRRPLARGVGALLATLRDELDAPVPEGVPEALAGRRAGALPPVLRPSSFLGRESPVDGRAAGLLLRWRLLGGPAAVLRDMAHAALPSRAWLRARYGEEARTTPGRWLRYVGDVARWITGRARSPASPNQELLD